MLFRESLRERWKGLSASQIISQLGPLGSLDLQEDHKQSEFKASYYCPIDHLNKGIVKKIEERLSEIEQEASIVCSIDPIAKCGLVDLLPPGITKDFAVRFLQKLLKLSAEDVVYAGDSGNDLAVFLSDYKSILVGNTPESIKEQVKEEAKAKGALEKHYFAKQPYAAGVLEGLKAFAWIG
jgi:hydroxymethylpyrimidine pyrophosphatase-like HAD family hydrolase